MFFCCLGGWRRAICVLDNINHALLRRFRIRRLCDIHDDWIVREFDADGEVADTMT